MDINRGDQSAEGDVNAWTCNREGTTVIGQRGVGNGRHRYFARSETVAVRKHESTSWRPSSNLFWFATGLRNYADYEVPVNGDEQHQDSEASALAKFWTAKSTRSGVVIASDTIALLK